LWVLFFFSLIFNQINPPSFFMEISASAVIAAARSEKRTGHRERTLNNGNSYVDFIRGFADQHNRCVFLPIHRWNGLERTGIVGIEP
jgi:hypothetical protein